MTRTATALLAAVAFLLGAGVSAIAKPPPSILQTDDAAGIVRVVVDGREIVAIDATGLRVNGDVAYTGTIADTGASP